MRTSIRTVALLATLLLGGSAGAASAEAQAPPVGKPVPMTGNANGQRAFTGTFTVERFIAAGGRAYAIGRLRGTARGRRVSRTVRIPAALAPGAPPATASQTTPPIPPTPN